MEKTNCKRCNKPIIGTKRIKFCSDSCRAAFWQDEKRKDNRNVRKMKVSKQSAELTVEKAQLQVLAGLVTLREAAKVGDRFAIRVLNEVNRQLDNIEMILRVERIRTHEEN